MYNQVLKNKMFTKQPGTVCKQQCTRLCNDLVLIVSVYPYVVWFAKHRYSYNDHKLYAYYNRSSSDWFL